MLRSLAENSFSVMSYNVAGLPEILSSGNPSENSVEIGKRISNWDVVNVQEDFNYHAYIYSENSHLYRTATSGGVPFGDGLNTLSNYSFSNITDLTRTKWEDCSTFDGADCLTPKGFTFLEIQLADGVTFDLYNLHTDAGVTDADEVARAANLAQLSEYITANSADNAVIVMGDTNTRYTRSDDTIREFVEGLGLTDGWVQYVRNGVFPTKGADAIVCDESNMTNTCEVVDKILFRGNNYITLSLQKWNNENAGFLDNDGNMLSDHPPISSTFSWALNEGIRLSNAVGGPHGDQFTDVASAAGGQTVKSITLRSGSRVDAVSLTISSPTSTTFSHGGTGGTAKTLALSSGEYITSIEVHWGKYNSHTRIFYLKFATSLGNTLSGGTTTSESATVYAPDGYQLSAFHGRDGDAIDALGAIWTKISS
ncbi:Phospholipase D gamma 3 [Phytophthora cinnamomi]|uniref:Phospholipase D gamma 3 n=1 Tax=Phytophthora cinnamomi TaxID=4785 RepID=UPI003559B72C|nr:Phospholipase D gamma 3 [Phytophthora cinnamomi]